MVNVWIADADYAATVPEIASDFRNLTLITSVDDETGPAQPPDADAIVAQMAAVGEATLAKMSNLKTVVKVGRSYFNIDAEAVRARGLTFIAVPRKGPNCVAELALTFIMALSKDLIASHDSVAEGAYRYRGLKPEITAQWKMAFHWMKNTRVHEVGGKTLGIIGMGEIGCELARRTSVLGMRNLYYKRTPLSEELERRFDARYRDLPALLAESDYVCVALPHTPETERMIGVEQIDMMKESAFIVNIARGGIIDEDAMIDALRTNRIAGAGLDVFTYEPLPEDSPLCTLDNVMLSPHIGGGTGTNRRVELSAALIELERVLAGERPMVDLGQAR